MTSTGGYPLGAEHDSRAPWKQKDPIMTRCPACNGKGHFWYAYDLVTHQDRECTEEEWDSLPATEDETLATGVHVIRGEVETCEVCEGEGEIEYESDYEPDPDEY